MANYTEADLAAIRAAIASGELSITSNGRRVDFRSMDDLLKAEARILEGLQAQRRPGRSGIRRMTFSTLRGD